MKISFEGTPEEVRSQVAEFFGLAIAAPEQQGEAPTPISAAPGKPGRPRKQAPPVDTTAAAGAPPPAPPAPAEPVKTMVPLCTDHANSTTIGPNIKPIPAEKSGCAMCTAAGKAPVGKKMTVDEVKAVAQELGESRPDGWDICFRILESLGAESITGAADPDTGKPTKALDPEKYEQFAREFTAALAPAAPAKRKL